MNQRNIKIFKPKEPEHLNLENILNFIYPKIKSLESQILKNVNSDQPLLNKISEHILNSKAKRLRPTLVVLGAEMFNGANENVMIAAQVIEYLHTATLLHDDVVDGAETRRQKKTVSKIWGNEASVISGDFLLAIAFHTLTKFRNLEVMNLISDTTTKMAKAELLQLMRPFKKINEKEYLEIVINKTASLFAAAIKTGAILAGADKKSAKQLYDYGMKLGIAFQITDDALDYTDEEKIGKPVGGDLKERKITLPLSHLIKTANNADKKRLNSILALEKIEKSHVKEVINLMNKYDAINYSLNVSKEYVSKAKKIIYDLPPTSLKETLNQIADYIVNRKL
tara:strand:+ start:11 stop:1027 length:1017 start_codon:yes stop_codon:yes gene_type:complete